MYICCIQVDDAFVSNINRIYYWNIDNWEDFLYNGAIPQVLIMIILANTQ